jgi:hypothetical protein
VLTARAIGSQLRMPGGWCTPTPSTWQAAIEPIEEARARIPASGTEIISVRRLFEAPIDSALIV